MVNDEQLPIPPLEQITSAYEASPTGDCRRILTSTLVSSTAKMRKFILEYSMAYTNQQGEEALEIVVGKLYSNGEKGLASYQLMQYVWDRGMGTDPYYRIIRPIAYLETWQLLLMSQAPGRTLHECIHAGTDVKQAAFLAANWLSRLHSIPPANIQKNERTRANANINRFVKDLEIAVPNKLSDIQSIYNGLLTKSAMKWTGHPVLLHGDFHPNNVFLDGHRVYAIDFDHHFAGDPAWDVAYLACQIQLSGFFKQRDFHYFDPVVRHLIDSYLDFHPFYDRQSFLDRLFLYRANSLFESLHYHLCVLKDGTLDIVDVFLGECEQALQGKGFG
ncbi:Phosphotransferase enzyme family protein [Paenibacillus sp. yr247]|uniref:phosphotransferase family protein n=1 Tax=Paenibacillus sp. yr247 TaxID=1761880 RepID=UPI0008821C13|nr:aminoglycoside phosphotransferase family protein [Paenibacillus sp. yr247]SDN60080.1 Phosphotransferase enzyme family protein [Paenibacillus sp. yr247]